ncbi:unnamed protein product [Arabis nemorensis]|uniref:Uncharacterized protein n=1 Tax=Arabis nemorensis TaxID=586526 RepID=A0A565BLR4_9BRAS|nr:unnamed protein product [Arabis nemorensis]
MAPKPDQRADEMEKTVAVLQQELGEMKLANTTAMERIECRIAEEADARQREFESLRSAIQLGPLPPTLSMVGSYGKAIVHTAERQEPSHNRDDAGERNHGTGTS